MSCSLRFLLVLLAAFAATADVQAARKAARRTATHHARTAPRHTSRSKTTHYRRPAVHRRTVKRVQHRTTRIVRRPVKRTVVRTVRRYPVHRVHRSIVRRPYSVGRHSRHHRRYTYNYYPGRYNWRTSYYNRVRRGSRRHVSRGIRGIVEGVQGNAGNGMVLVKVHRPRSSRFRYRTTNAGAGRGSSAVHRFHVNNGTRYEMLSAPPKGTTFAALHKGEHVLILRHGKQANTAQKVEVFPRRKR